jgi:nicotinamidase-related amidase
MFFLTQTNFKVKVDEWARACAIPEKCEMHGDLDAPALLVLDMQNEFLLPTGQMQVWGGPAIIPNVVRLIDRFRQDGNPVVFSRHICLEPYKHKDTLQSMKGVSNFSQFLREGSKGAHLHRQIRPMKNELVITKYKYSAFYDSPLDSFLRVNKIKQLVITGVATNICCDSTARDAFYRGYSVFFPIDGSGGIDEATHLATLQTMRMSFGQLCRVDQFLT